ncbi:nickel-dependent hydrogenase large subunit [bacterium]|nr:nickel-dependent hydrogenase large subunit [bacterium]
MATTIVIDPVTRIEGHLKIEAVVDDGVVKEARSSGTLWRGFEQILEGRNPLDAQRITQRICGVCPTAHSTASTLNLDSAFGIADKVPNNGRVLRNLIFGSNFLQSHILHFYHLTALDYVDVTAVAGYRGTDPDLNQVANFISNGNLAPFVPRYEGDYRLPKKVNIAATKHYVEALNMRRLTQEMLAIFGGHMPHNMSIMPGGVTEQVSVDKIADFRWRLEKVRHFIDNVYIPDVLAVAGVYDDYFGIGGGVGNYMAYGVFEMDQEPDLTKRKRFFPGGRVKMSDLKPMKLDPNRITEHVSHSWYKSDSKLHPSVGKTEAAHDKRGAYSWMKSPRYDNEVYEVGPLARQVNAYVRGEEPTVTLVNSVLGHFKADASALKSTLGRHAARAIEAKIVADEMAKWVLELAPGEPTMAVYDIPESGMGMGITDAPRGSLGHWITIKDHKIDNYQAVVPTTWNGGPRDDKGQPGPFEQALEGTKVRDAKNPFELVRIVRSFDPCLACAIHVVDAHDNDMGKFVVS